MRRNRGFTLVELVVYMGLLTIILAILSQIFGSLTDIQLESESNSTLNQDEAFIVSRLGYDIRRASSISTPASNGTGSVTLSLVISGTTYVYSLSNGNLMLNDGTNSWRLNSYNTTVSGLDFDRIGNAGGKSTIRTTLQLDTLVNTRGNNSKTIVTTVSLR